LNPDVPVTRQTPPTFLLVQAENDDVDSVNNSPVADRFTILTAL